MEEERRRIARRLGRMRQRNGVTGMRGQTRRTKIIGGGNQEGGKVEEMRRRVISEEQKEEYEVKVAYLIH